MSKVIVFTTDTCVYCPQLKRWLEKQGIEYEEKDMIKYGWELKKYTDSFSPPISIVNGQPVQGLNYMRIRKLLEEAS